MPPSRYTRRRFVAGAATFGAALAIPWRAAPAAQEPAARPLVPREILFGDPDRAWARLSSDGAWLSYIAPVDGVRNLWVAPVADLAAARPVTRATDRPIGSEYQWAYTNRHLVFAQDRDGDENWRISSVDVMDGTVVPLTPPRGVRAHLQEMSRRYPSEMLFGHNGRDKRFFDLHRVNILTGR